MAFEFDDMDISNEIIDEVGKQEGVKKPKLRGVVDIIFLIDVSGSMAPAIEKLTKNIDFFIKNIDPTKIKNYRVKIGSFSDLEVDSSNLAMNLDRPWRENPQITQSLNLIKNDLNECKQLVLDFYGGGDEPESSLDAIYRAIDLFTEDPNKRKRVIVLFTDASPKEIHSSTIDSDDTDREDKVQLLVQKILNERVYLFLYAPVADDYRYLSEHSNERVTYEALNEDGSNPVDALRKLDFSKVLETLGKSISQTSNLS
jgi:uncharacterized protein YegL